MLFVDDLQLGTNTLELLILDTAHIVKKTTVETPLHDKGHIDHHHQNGRENCSKELIV